MNKRLNDMFIPQMAIIVYKTDNSEYYLERRNIKRDGTFSAAFPLSQECLSNLLTSFSQADINTVHGIVPNNMLFSDSRIGEEKYVWFRKEEKRHMLFSESSGLKDGEMIVPPLVYRVYNETLAVYAYKGKLKENSHLFRAPFLNVTDSYVCLGNAKIEKPEERTYQNIINYWEDMFWKSEFGHILGDNPVSGDLIELTAKCISDGIKFPLEQLCPVSLTLKDLLQ